MPGFCALKALISGSYTWRSTFCAPKLIVTGAAACSTVGTLLAGPPAAEGAADGLPVGATVAGRPLEAQELVIIMTIANSARKGYHRIETASLCSSERFGDMYCL